MAEPRPLEIRAITPADAASITRMWSEFSRYLRELGDTDEQAFGTEVFLRDGFGPDPAFLGIIAERGDTPVGYLLYHFGYDVDRGARVMYIVDLWVVPSARRGGAGRALMSAAAARCRARGGIDMIWSIFTPNKLAIEFYRRLGAEFFKDLAFMHIPADRL